MNITEQSFPHFFISKNIFSISDNNQQGNEWRQMNLSFNVTCDWFFVFIFYYTNTDCFVYAWVKRMRDADEENV